MRRGEIMEQTVAEHKNASNIWYFFLLSIITTMIIDANKSEPRSPMPVIVCRHKSISVCACRTQSESNPVRAKKIPRGGTVPQSGEEGERKEEDEEEGD